MNDIDWMDVKEKDDTIREYRRKLTEAYNHIAELEADNIDLSEAYAKATRRIAELERELEAEHDWTQI